MKKKEREKDLARKLRQDGKSITEIAKELNVAKSSAFSWVRDVPLSDEQREKFAKSRLTNYEAIRHFAERNRDAALDLRKQYQEEGKNKARDGNTLHAIGCMLYWGEGTKSRNTCSVINTDVHLLRLFIKFLKECYGCSDDDFIMRLLLHSDIDVSEAKRYWASELKLPIEMFSQITIKPHNARVHRKILYGMCQITVKKSTRIVQSIYGAIQEYGKFCNEVWIR